MKDNMLKILSSVFLIIIMALSCVIWFSYSQIGELKNQKNVLQSQNCELSNLNSSLTEQNIFLQEQIKETRNQTAILQNQMEPLQNQNEILLNQTNELQEQIDALNQTLNEFTESSNLKITAFSHSEPESIVFGYTTWLFSVEIQNIGQQNASELILEVKQMINGQTMNYTARLNVIPAGEKLTVEGYVGCAGVWENFLRSSSTWIVTIKEPQAASTNTFH
jgi:hypothetical protein